MAEAKLAERWGGKSLPFPILLDATGETVRTFGIDVYPTNVLVDPDGRISKGGIEKVREQRPEETRKAAAPPAR